MPFTIVKTPNNEGEATAFNPARHSARASDGTLWCCYAGPVAAVNQIFLSYSLDNGVTWTELPAITAAARNQENPAIAIDSLDNINLVWHGQIAVADWEIYFRQRTAAGVLGAIEAVTAVVQRQRSPSIAVDSADNVQIVWVGSGWGGNPLRRNVQFRMRTAAGVWQAQEAVTDIATNQLWDSASIAIDATDTAHIVWSGQGWGVNVGDYNLQYRTRSAAGIWTPPLAGAPTGLTDLATWNHMACIALNLAGTDVRIVWYAETLFGAIWDVFFMETIAGVWQAFDQYFPSLIWAFHPTVGGVKPNVLDDYLFVFTGQNVPAALRIEFYNPVTIPTVTTDAATDILQELAAVNGTLDDDGGEACDCGFEWGETPAYGNTTPTQSRTTGQTFSQELSGLSPNVTYHFRAFATNSEGTGYGADRTLTTQELLRINRAFALSREGL